MVLSAIKMTNIIAKFKEQDKSGENFRLSVITRIVARKLSIEMY